MEYTFMHGSYFHAFFIHETCTLSSKSIIVSIAFLAAPRAIELTVNDDKLCPPLQPYFLWFALGSTLMPCAMMAMGGEVWE